MANKMSICIIKYTYTQYAGVDIEKYTRGLFEYVKEAFGEFQPEMSEPGTIPVMMPYNVNILSHENHHTAIAAVERSQGLLYTAFPAF